MEESEIISRQTGLEQNDLKPDRIRRTFRVCVIGAGLAGLSAAENLLLWSGGVGDIDVQVTVLEATERPGGRAVTLPFAGGIVEGGAQYIHGCEGNAVYHRAKANKLKLINCVPGFSHYNIHQQDSKRVPSSLISEVSDMYSEVLFRTQAESHREERRNCGDETVGAFMMRFFQKYFRATGGSPKEKRTKANIFRKLVIRECCYSACNNLHDLMLADFGEYKEILGNMKFANGYKEFLDTFLKNIPSETIIFNKPVQTVNWNSEKKEYCQEMPILITCDDGEEYEADYVVVTSSLGYLKEHATHMFAPPLPASKLDLITRMGFGTAGKIWLEYKTPFWTKDWGGLCLVWDKEPSDIMKDDFKKEEWYMYITDIERVASNPRLLRVWTCGKAAKYIETLDNTCVADTLTGILRQFLNNPAIPAPTSILKSQWYSNPYVRGSYSYVAAGSSGADIDSLAEPVCMTKADGHTQPIICFAGEATHRTFYSTTHGAMLSGQREAERIISDICLQSSKLRISEDDGRIRSETQQRENVE
ncbi:peroxisomal N(1)-acetyl-spermine/spermidine oxidase-like [Diadema antillarum]|uniref:peroxisomal N(1)-acetyl-spermine/spermidine oxidase-like n=1 Tax=Diadema antillarum TaxID=105358 RepID=UPI003A891A57